MAEHNDRYEKEVKILLDNMAKLLVLVTPMGIYQWQTAVEALQECNEIIEETMDVITEGPLQMNAAAPNLTTLNQNISSQNSELN